MHVRAEFYSCDSLINIAAGRDDGIAEKGQLHPATWGKQWSTGNEKGAKSRMPQRTALARARLRRYDTFDARLSNKLSTLWHSPRNRASIYDRWPGRRHSRTNERICWLWRGLQGGDEHYMHAIVFVHPLCHAHRKLRFP